MNQEATMDPYFVSDGVTIYHGDCRDIIATLPDNSIDAVVTDPPYELSFMGKSWDGTGIAYNVDLWRECLRVLKPGGHLLAFGGTRTYHRMACAIEDAGFEIRDSIQWIYGQGFPKSLNIGKAIDKAAGAEREVVGSQRGTYAAPENGVRDVGGFKTGIKQIQIDLDITAPATPEAKQWEGWGTALKPAHEPIVLARKPLIGTVADTVLTHGTGGLNIDATRIGYEDGGSQCEGGDACKCGHGYSTETPVKHAKREKVNFNSKQRQQTTGGAIDGAFGAAGLIGQEIPKFDPIGRFPSNVLLDEHTAELLDQQVPDVARFFYCAKPSTAERDAGLHELPEIHPSEITGRKIGSAGAQNGGFAGTTETPKRNIHPTVKPIALMRYLCRLITPPGGTILEPFTGSGTTIAAAVFEDFNVIGCEMTDEYLPIITARTRWAQTTNPDNPNTTPATPQNVAPTLF
jgi:DNA modification methylase